jgi:uncharacterized protein (DUF927 family)
VGEESRRHRQESEGEGMKLSVLIKELQYNFDEFGDVEVQLQNNFDEVSKGIGGNESFFIIPEKYLAEDGGQMINIRSWPY